MKQKGFTLVEILTVIILIGLVTVLAVASINSVNRKVRERILQTKISAAEQSARTWINDNENCFRTPDAIDCIVGINNGCTVDENIVSCDITFDELAASNIIKYDNENDKIIINPVNNNSLNSEIISFKYDINRRLFFFDNNTERIIKESTTTTRVPITTPNTTPNNSTSSTTTTTTNTIINMSTINIIASKNGTNDIVSSNTWSDTGLNYKFIVEGENNYTIKYCKDTTNECTPNNSIPNNTLITNYNNDTGIYYIRYKLVENNNESEIKSYIAKVDRGNPTVKLTTYMYNESFENNAGILLLSEQTYNNDYTLTIGNTWYAYGFTFKFDTSAISGIKSIVWKWNDAGSANDTGNTYQNENAQTSPFNTKYATLTASGFRKGQWVVTSNTNKTITITVVVRIDTITPTVSIKAVKQGTNTEVASGTMSNTYLNYIFTAGETGLSGYTIYYCDRGNSNGNCMLEANEATSGSVITGSKTTDYNSYAGIYYIDYLIESGSGKRSAIATYQAVVNTDGSIPLPTTASQIASNPSDYGLVSSGGGYRYEGANPNNYITFNGETWRIIGVFDVKTSESGTSEKRFKLIRNDSIGNSIFGLNNTWSTSNIATYLNNNSANGTPWSNFKLNETAMSQIDNAVWYIGDSQYMVTASQAYTNEQSATWTGKMGLMSTSDYGFASSSCKDGAQKLYYYNNSSCTGSNWLKKGISEWTMIPDSSTSFSNVLYVDSLGFVFANTISNSGPSFGVRPVVYLKTNVKISGKGTSSEPFSIEEIKPTVETMIFNPSDYGLVSSGGGYRYEGANPNNYATFNGETWRIIGIFDVKTSENGTSEKRFKIIKNDSIGTSRFGSNNTWSSSTIATNLNNNSVIGTAWLNFKLNETARAQIDDAVWHIGSSITNVTASQAYTNEQKATWTGKMGLMSASDYGFASSSCKDNSQGLYVYNNSSCTGSNWLFKGVDEWTMIPEPSYYSNMLNVDSTGYIFNRNSYNFSYIVRPVVYLKSNIKISGKGTTTNPYTFSL